LTTLIENYAQQTVRFRIARMCSEDLSRRRFRFFESPRVHERTRVAEQSVGARRPLRRCSHHRKHQTK